MRPATMRGDLRLVCAILCALVLCAGGTAAAEGAPWFTLPDGQKVRLGCLPDDPAEVAAHRVVAPEVRPSDALPAAVDLSASMPPPGSQGSQGSCAAWAAIYAQKTYEEGLEQGWDLTSTSHQFSPAFTYNQVRSAAAGGGSSLTGNLKRICDVGAPTLADVPYNQNDDDTWPRDPEVWRRGMPYGAGSWASYACTTDADLEALKGILVSGHVLTVSIPVYTNFDVTGDDFYEGPGVGDTTDGSHAICVVGYDDNADNGDADGVQGGFKIQNSWGASWGGDGRAYISYAFIKQYSTTMFLLNDEPSVEPTAWAEINIDHGCHADLTVTLGCLGGGTRLTPFKHNGQRDATGDDDDIVAGIDISDSAALLPPTAANAWFVQVEDDRAGETGQIVELVVHQESPAETWTSTDSPVAIADSTAPIMWLPTGSDAVLVFDDANLEGAVRDALGIPTGDMHVSDTFELTSLDAANLGITDLGGIGSLKTLTELLLEGNLVTDLAPLSGLTDLATLNLHSNPVSSLAALDGLTKLTYLDVGDAGVSDLTPLTPLTSLQYLYLDSNSGITDLTPLAGLTGIKSLGLWQSSVSDLSVLAGFPALYYLSVGYAGVSDLTPLASCPLLAHLYLAGNAVRDVEPLRHLGNLQAVQLYDNEVSSIAALAGNPGMNGGDTLDLRYNWLDTSAGSPTSGYLAALTGRGVTVQSTNQTAKAAMLIPAGWVMLSVPRAPTSNTYNGVFGDDFTLAGCVMYRWDAAARQYVSVASADALSGSQGYWFLSNGGDLDVSGREFQGDLSFALSAGWNLVAAPRACALSALQVQNGATQLPLGDAGQTWVSPTLYRWDNATSRYVACTPGGGGAMCEWSGYWVLATEACNLIVPAPVTGAAEVAAPIAAAPQKGWSFALEAQVAEGAGTDNVVVAGSASASGGFDGLALDQPKAPTPPAGGVRMVLAGPTTGPAAAWTSELQQETQNWGSADGATYRLGLSGPAGATVTVRWPDLSRLPNDAAAWLVNPATGSRTYLRTQQATSVRLSDEGGRGTAELEVQVRPKVAGAALVSALSAGSGDGSTEVAFTLSADASVTVRVLNLAGRPVATVVADRACAPGRQQVVWNQHSTGGTKVPAGRYLCVVQARTQDGQSLQQTCPVQVRR